MLGPRTCARRVLVLCTVLLGAACTSTVELTAHPSVVDDDRPPQVFVHLESETGTYNDDVFVQIHLAGDEIPVSYVDTKWKLGDDGVFRAAAVFWVQELVEYDISVGPFTFHPWDHLVEEGVRPGDTVHFRCLDDGFFTDLHVRLVDETTGEVVQSFVLVEGWLGDESRTILAGCPNGDFTLASGVAPGATGFVRFEAEGYEPTDVEVHGLWRDPAVDADGAATVRLRPSD